MNRIGLAGWILVALAMGCSSRGGDDAGGEPDGGAFTCASWGDVGQVWRIVWVVGGVTAPEGEETYMRVDSAAMGTNSRKCVFIDEPSGPDELNCGGINPLRGTLAHEGTTWSMAFEVDPEEPQVNFTGSALDACDRVSGSVVYGDEPGTFEATLMDVVALGWVIAD